MSSLPSRRSCLDSDKSIAA
uniref:Uncharacterized protein n=1 Tax=Rhizophora mucronata TaxID=61149 RepID=A0A2P2NK38_RHIMU